MSYKEFLKGYILAHHTVDLDTLNQVDALTDEYLNNELDRNLVFTEIAVMDYLEYLRLNMDEKNKHFLNFRFTKYKYIIHLENFIKRFMIFSYT